MNNLKVLLFALVWVCFSCAESYIDDIEPVAQGSDMEPPEVTVNFPLEGTQIRVTEDVTTLNVDFEVEDDIEIDNIVLELNGSEIARFEDFKDYRRVLEEYQFDNLDNGDHNLAVIATDLSGKTTTESVSFEKIEPYRPVYDNEIFYVPFDGDYTELVNVQNPSINGDPGFADGQVGRAYEGSSNGYLTYGAERLTNDQFSAVFWYKVNPSPDRAGLLVMGPPDEANPDAMNNRTAGFRLFRESAGAMQRIKLNIGNGSGENWFDGGAAADIDPAANEWVHIAFTISGSSAAVYIDGQVVSEGEFPGIDWENCDLLSVGSGAPRFSGWGHLSTESLLDELRIFDKVLSQEEIVSIMEEESGL